MIDIHTKYEEQQLLIQSGAWTSSSSSSLPADGSTTLTLTSTSAEGSTSGGYQNPVFNLEAGGEGVQTWHGGGEDISGQRYEYLQIQQSQYWRRLTVEQQQRWNNNSFHRVQLFPSDTAFTLPLQWKMQPVYYIQASELFSYL